MEFARYIYLDFSNWPYEVVSLDKDECCVVVDNDKVVGVSSSALEMGVSLGVSLNYARALSPDLVLRSRDLMREKNVFDEVLNTLEEFSPYLFSPYPGEVYLPQRSIVRFYGNEENALGALRTHLGKLSVVVGRQVKLLSELQVQIGASEGVFAARLASHEGRVLTPGSSREFVNELDVSTLGSPEMSDLLANLGIGTLGEFAALDPGDIAGRFGRSGLLLHRLVAGEMDYSHAPFSFEDDPEVHLVFDEDIGEAERVLFALAGPLSDAFESILNRGTTPTLVEMEIKFGDRWTTKSWRFPDGTRVKDLLDRARWQLELMTKDPRSYVAHARQEASFVFVQEVRVILHELVPASGRQLGLGGDRDGSNEAVSRSLSRLSTLLGEDKVRVIELQGGRSPEERFQLKSWEPSFVFGPAQPRLEKGSKSTQRRQKNSKEWQGLKRLNLKNEGQPPWPGSWPDQQPSLLYGSSVAIQVLGANREPVGVGSRGMLTSEVHFVVVEPNGCIKVKGYKGPWTVEERWWSPSQRRRYARLLLELGDGSLHLAVCESQRWRLEATFD